MFVQQTVCLVENVCVHLVLAHLNVRFDFFQCIRWCQAYANLFQIVCTNIEGEKKKTKQTETEKKMC